MKYRKKPVVIEAWEFTKESLKNRDSWVRKYPEDLTLVSQYGGEKVWLEIDTLEGIMIANEGDFIIKGLEDELYPCKPDIFEATYAKVN